jgi:hypothetical protein
MRKIFPLIIVGFLVLYGFGAVALKIDNEKFELKTIESETPIQEGRDFTHHVLAEFGTTSSCPHCPPVSTYLKDIYDSGDYNFYFITLNADYESLALGRYWEIPGASGSVPQVFFDGGYSNLIGNQGSKYPYISQIENAGARSVADIDLNVGVEWLGNAEIEVTVSVTNNEGSSYNGHLHAYVTEIVSRWYDNQGRKYHYSMIGYAFNKNINVGASDTWSDTATWDGNSHGYGNIQKDNIIVIATVLDSTSKFVDETAAATPNGGGTNNPPEPPTITGPIKLNPGVEYEYTFSSIDPEGDDVSYYINWGDGDFEPWSDFQLSGDDYVDSHIWDEEGNLILKAKAKDIHGDESDWSRVSIKIPKSKAMINSPLILRFIERFPNAFQILQNLLRQ